MSRWGAGKWRGLGMSSWLCFAAEKGREKLGRWSHGGNEIEIGWFETALYVVQKEIYIDFTLIYN